MKNYVKFVFIFSKGNLKDFNGTFDVGVAIHSCGSLADLIIEKCLEKKADIILSPCCYGSIKEIKVLSKGKSQIFIKYPRSQVFEEIFSNISQIESIKIHDYLYSMLVNFSDRTEKEKLDEENGFIAMNLIDKDRLLYLKEKKYSFLKLTKMQPEDCTTKNNILIAKYYL